MLSDIEKLIRDIKEIPIDNAPGSMILTGERVKCVFCMVSIVVIYLCHRLSMVKAG